MKRTVLTALFSSLAVAFVLLGAVPPASATGARRPATHAAPVRSGPIVRRLVKYPASPPLRTLKGAPAKGGGRRVIPLHAAPPLPRGKPNALKAPIQPRVAPRLMPMPSSTFPGVGNGFSGPQGTFSVPAIPPDTNGAVGPQDYVQIVNTDFAVFNKDRSRGTVGAVRYGPVAINTLWSGVGGLCQADNDGDPIVAYDRIANRWVISQLAVTGATTTYYECIAVSTGSDPTGSYYRYVASYSTFDDYPKMAVWPDAYYVTYNMFQSASNPVFVGAEACALDRTSMLSGLAASQVCFSLSSDFSLLPSTLDGSQLPPSGSPDYLLELGTTTSLLFWKFHVDFATPSNSTFTGPTSIAVASFTEPCSGTGCIPQPGTSQRLDGLGDRLMYRLAYRNFGSYESLVVDHAVTAGSSVGMRWYEIRNPASTPTLYQEGTYAPDANYRWMGSIAEDHLGDMAMGFSLSGSSTYPSIAITGRLASDTLGTMSQGEEIVTSGTGAQTLTGQDVNRWGDYTSMGVDPTDDCTFWYTNEYIPSNGAFNWKTSIVSFRFPSCLGTQLIQNGGFESGTANWTEYSIEGQQTVYSSPQAHSGAEAFFPCGYADCDDRVAQTITIPATVNSATFSFWLRAFSSLGVTSPNALCLDHFYATLAKPDGTVISGGAIAPLCETAADSGYLLEQFNVTSLLQSYAGQQLTVMFRGTTANESGAPGAYTRWGVDDVSLLVS